MRNLPEILEAPVPLLSPEEAASIASDVFAVTGTAKPLAGERDANFRIQTDDCSFLLKVTNSHEDAAVSRFQTAVYMHIVNRRPDFPIPHLLADDTGSPDPIIALRSGSRHVVKLMTFLPGRSGKMMSVTPDLRQDLARRLAELDSCLASFPEEAPDSGLLWDISRADRLIGKIHEINGKEDRALVKRAFDRWQRHVAPILSECRAQVIHNDLNQNNYLVDDQGHLSGIIDFGDSLRAPLINDLATLAAYQLDRLADPVGELGKMTAAYHAVYPLLPSEIGLLFDLVTTRWAIGATIMHWRAKQKQELASRIQSNELLYLRCLQTFKGIDPGAARERLLSACGMGT